MSYGISIFKADGSLGFSTADITWQFLDQFVVSANTSFSHNYTEASGLEIIVQRQLYDAPPNSQEDYVPNATVSGTTVSISPQSGLSSSKCLVIVLARDT